ncbi:MAG TPA: acyl-CoA thioesterase [Bacteroidetes bacterium]|nr:acyl-CoA thioesterase [Bacteroidota bacterium]
MPDRPLLHTAHVPVRWGDMDALGHVNNATYFTYAEQARIEWLAHVFPEGWPDDGGPILASIRADYRAPVHAPATVSVEVLGGEAGRSSLMQGYRLLVDDRVVCEVEAVLVWVSKDTGRPVSLPDAIRASNAGDIA